MWRLETQQVKKIEEAYHSIINEEKYNTERTKKKKYERSILCIENWNTQ